MIAIMIFDASAERFFEYMLKAYLIFVYICRECATACSLQMFYGFRVFQ